MENAFLHKHLESGLVPLSPDSEQLHFQLEWKELPARVKESPAGEVRQDVTSIHQTLEHQGLPSLRILPYFNEVKHWICSVNIVSDLWFCCMVERAAS